MFAHTRMRIARFKNNSVRSDATKSGDETAETPALRNGIAWSTVLRSEISAESTGAVDSAEISKFRIILVRQCLTSSGFSEISAEYTEANFHGSHMWKSHRTEMCGLPSPYFQMNLTCYSITTNHPPRIRTKKHFNKKSDYLLAICG